MALQITIGKGGKVSVAGARMDDGSTGVREFKDATEALQYVAAENQRIQDEADAKAAQAAKPIQPSITDRGQLSVRFGDRTIGAFPAFQLTGAQFTMLDAHWSEVRDYYTANKAKIVQKYQDLPPSTKTKGGKSAAQ